MSLLKRVASRSTQRLVEPNRLSATESQAPHSGSEVAFLRDALSDERRDDILLRYSGQGAEGRKPGSPHEEALLLAGWRRFHEASAVYRRLVENEDASADLLVDAAWCEHLNGKFDAAIALLDRARMLDDGVAVDFAWGVAQLARGEAAAARDALARVARVDPSHRDVWLNLAMAEGALGNAASAESALREAIANAPRSAGAWCVLGRMLMIGSRKPEAFAAYSKARELELSTGDDTRATALHAVGLYEAGHYEEAIRLCEASLPNAPDATANTGYALALLTVGRYAQGWDQYEFRWFDEPMRSLRARYDRPFWVGQPLAGKTVLLRGEQGIGDVVQFARYASTLARRGARVRMHVRPGMGKLAAGFKDVHDVVETLEVPPQFDFHANMLTVPRVVGTTLETVPATVPYLSVADDLREKWRHRIVGEGLRVGLVWAGNPAHPRDAWRSVPIRILAPLWRVEGVSFYSLQKEVRESDRAHLPPGADLTDLGSSLDDLTDAAAAIACLDLVIAVDTSLAHIAGALGKPVWLLLPELPDFRWMTGRDSSPWYPGMRLFRTQPGQGWPEVVERLREMLVRLASGDRTLLAGEPEPVISQREALAPGMPRVGEMRDGIMQFLPDRDDEARSLALLGEYLAGQLDLVANLIPVDGWVLEAGSGCGSHALGIANMLEGRGELFLYESDPAVARMLKQNLDANRIADQVTLPRGSLEPGPALSGPRSGPVHTVDDLQLARLDLLKVCSPAAERILGGSTRTLWSLRPRVLASIDDDDVLIAVANLLRVHGYRTWRVSTPLFRIENYNRWPEDPFHGRTASAILGIPEEADVGAYVADFEEIR